MAPPGFPPLHYLNKPVLPGMAGSMDQNSGNAGANGLEAYALPELLPGQQQNSSANNSSNQQNGTSHTNSTTSGSSGRHPNTSPANHKPPKPHSDLRLFKCLTCGKDFKQKSTLLQHDRIHTDARPYPCSECGKRFRQQSHLTQHLRIHANEKPFTCGYCSRSFRQRAILNQHIRIHSGEKPFACPECGKHFRQKAILNQHVRTHQGERQFLNQLHKNKQKKKRKRTKNSERYIRSDKKENPPTTESYSFCVGVTKFQTLSQKHFDRRIWLIFQNENLNRFSFWKILFCF